MLGGRGGPPPAPPTVLAVDPGHRWVAAVVRRGSTLVAWDVLDRREAVPAVTVATLDDAAELDLWMTAIVDLCGRLLDNVAYPRSGAASAPRLDVVAVERTVPPTGFRDGRRAPIDPGPLMDTAQAGGAAFAWAAANGIAALMVTPDRHGTVPDGFDPNVARQVLVQSYPPELVGPRETTGRGKSRLQHARAAWDVAAAGARRYRQRTTGARP